jgi:hypothetical protein
MAVTHTSEQSPYTDYLSQRRICSISSLLSQLERDLLTLRLEGQKKESGVEIRMSYPKCEARNLFGQDMKTSGIARPVTISREKGEIVGRKLSQDSDHKHCRGYQKLSQIKPAGLGRIALYWILVVLYRKKLAL